MNAFKWIKFVLFSVTLMIFAACERGTDETNTGNNRTSTEAQKVSIRLKWLHQAQFAGFYYAKHEGLYQAHDLDVTLRPGGIDYPAVQMVASGSDDFGVTAADQILLAREKGVPIVAIACIFRKSPFVLFTLKESGITKVEEFRNKRVGVKLGGNEELTYRAMLKKAGLSSAEVEEIPVKFDLSLLLAGNVDVWPGYSINEPITAQEQGHEVNLIWPEHYDINLYADVLFTSEEMLRTNPKVVKAIVEATVVGWQRAFENRELAVEHTLKQSDQLTKEHERKMLDAAFPLVKPDDKPIGWMDREVWELMHKILRNAEFLKKDVQIDRSYRIDFLPNKGQ